jgi:folate-binding protein YgfZ
MQQSPLLDHHRAQGARVTGTQANAQVLTFGAVPEEYAAGTKSCSLIDASTCGAIAVRGPDAPAFLHRLLANEVLPLQIQEGNPNLLLTSKGKVQARFDLFRELDGYRLETPMGVTESLLTALDMYLFGEEVEFQDLDAECAALLLGGPRAKEIAEKTVGPLTNNVETRDWQGFPLRISSAEVAGDRGLRLDAGKQGCLALWQALQVAGATPLGRVAEDSLRVEALRPRWGLDINDEIYPSEARLDNEFNLEKGCYIGQEVVAKINTYGGLNKQLFCLALDRDDPLPLGSRLTRDLDGETRDLGLITTWAYSFLLDQAVALGYIKKRHQEPGTQFQVGDTGATATLLKGKPLRQVAGAWNAP